MILHHRLTFLLLSVLGRELTVRGAPRGPPSMYIAVKVRPLDREYTPWVDSERRECVFMHYSLPLSRCLQVYGQETVYSWPPYNQNPAVFQGIPGANIDTCQVRNQPPSNQSSPPWNAMLHRSEVACLLCAIVVHCSEPVAEPTRPPVPTSTAPTLNEPWIDEDANVCMIKGRPLAMALRLAQYGVVTVASWPIRMPGPKNSFPGSNIPG